MKDTVKLMELSVWEVDGDMKMAINFAPVIKTRLASHAVAGWTHARLTQFVQMSGEKLGLSPATIADFMAECLDEVNKDPGEWKGTKRYVD